MTTRARCAPGERGPAMGLQEALSRSKSTLKTGRRGGSGARSGVHGRFQILAGLGGGTGMRSAKELNAGWRQDEPWGGIARAHRPEGIARLRGPGRMETTPPANGG